jgi:undecaprenyl-diphosphatase
LSGVLIPLILFGQLCAQIRSVGSLPWDTSLLHTLHGYATPQLDSLVASATVMGGVLAFPVIGFAALGIGLLWRPVEAAFFLVSISGAWSLNVISKALFARARPALWMSPVPEFDHSFPSGHAMCSMAIAAAFIALAWPTRLRLLVLACSIVCVFGVGLSRLYLGVHYPSDIIGGWCASLLWVTVAYFILLRGAVKHEISVKPFTICRKSKINL